MNVMYFALILQSFFLFNIIILMIDLYFINFLKEINCVLLIIFNVVLIACAGWFGIIIKLVQNGVIKI